MQVCAVFTAGVEDFGRDLVGGSKLVELQMLFVLMMTIGYIACEENDLDESERHSGHGVFEREALKVKKAQCVFDLTIRWQEELAGANERAAALAAEEKARESEAAARVQEARAGSEEALRRAEAAEAKLSEVRYHSA